MDLKALLDDMSLEEKLGQLTQVNAVFLKKDVTTDVTGPAAYMHLSVGDMALMGSTLNFEGSEIMREIQTVMMAEHPHHIPLLFMQDVVHGYRTIFPIPLGMGCTFDPDTVRQCASMSAKEAAASGVSVTFAPMVDLVRDARWGRVMESTGEDPVLNSRMAAAFVEGFQGDTLDDKDHVAACVKHFAAYGAPLAGRDYNAVDMSDAKLHDEYLPAYRAAVEAGVRMVMPSFNTLNGIPSHANRNLLKDVLRDEWGFRGMVISDYAAYKEMITHRVANDDKHAAELALNAGCDVEMMSSTLFRSGKQLLKEGKITMEQIDEAVINVLRLKEELGLFEDPFRGASVEKEKALYLSPAHRDVCRRAAEKAAVLLKNKDVLPFDEKKIKTIALVGPFASEKGIKGFWSCAGRDEECSSVEEGIRARLPGVRVIVEKGCGRSVLDTDGSGIAAAASAAADADAVVLCLGEYQNESGEGNSRAMLELPAVQMDLARAVLAANSNVAALIFSGRPLALAALDAVCPAILEMWQPGTEGGNAAAALLMGDVMPTGKLSMTFPYCTGQVPIFHAHASTARDVKNPYEICKNEYVSRYIDAPVAPLYPFGYGLSYTTYEYGTPVLDKDVLVPGDTLSLSVDVTNTGKRAGVETVELYFRDCFASRERPKRQLCDFCKVSLAPGETKTVTFAIREEQLRFTTASGEFASEAGQFELFVGGDSTTDNRACFTLEKGQ